MVDLIRAMSASEARGVTHGVTDDSDGSVTLSPGTPESWRCEPVGDDWRVTLPSGKSAVASTVANALSAARLVP